MNCRMRERAITTMKNTGALRPLFLLIAVTLLIVFVYGRIDPEVFSGVDLKQYRAIAAESPRISDEIPRPFAYRLLGPYVVGLLPLPDHLGFYILSVLSSISLVILYFLLLRHFGVAPTVASFITVLFVLNRYLFGFTVWDYFQINDVLSLIYLVVMFRAMLKLRWGVFALVLLFGALTRETAFIMIPTAVAYLIEKKMMRSEGGKLVCAAVPGVAAFVLLRLLIHPADGPSLLEALTTCIAKLGSPQVWFRLFINAFSPLTFIPVIFFRRTLSFFKDHRYMLWFIVLVYISSLFGSDNERLLAPGFIVFYLLLAIIVQSELWQGRTVMFIILCGTFVSSFHHLYAAYPLPSRDMTVAFSFVSLTVVTLAVLISYAHRRFRAE